MGSCFRELVLPRVPSKNQNSNFPINTVHAHVVKEGVTPVDRCLLKEALWPMGRMPALRSRPHVKFQFPAAVTSDK
jgi:hypothetical protein